MTNAAKRRAIVFLILAGLITVLLATALPQLELQKGVLPPSGPARTMGVPQATQEPPVAVKPNTFIQSIIALFLFLVMIYLAIALRQRKINRKDLLRVLAGLAMLALILSYMLFSFSSVRIDMQPSEIEILPNDIPVAGPPLAPVPMTMLWVTWVVLALLLVLLVIGMMRARVRQRAASRDPLALEAEQAVEALKAGQNLSNVIIRCYEQMSLILQRERGVTLEETMTAREFEALLEKRGVPNPPVRCLTQLFEIARYAAQAPGPVEEAQALDCLGEIARFSQKRKPGGQK